MVTVVIVVIEVVVIVGVAEVEEVVEAIEVVEVVEVIVHVIGQYFPAASKCVDVAWCLVGYFSTSEVWLCFLTPVQTDLRGILVE